MGPFGRVYLDHASTSPIRPEAVTALGEWLGSADPGRVHTEGRMARAALEEARERVAGLLGTRPRQVIFTSGATEAINAAVFGALASGRGDHVVVPAVEHSAVRDASARSAAHVTVVGVDRLGRVDVDEVVAALTPATALVHCQWGNHEVGTLQPVDAVVAACRERGVLVHVDAAAAAGHVPIAFDRLGADLLSVSAHKLGGPKGAGALLIRKGLRIPSLLVGGEQERGRRAGMEDVAACAGFGAAAEVLAGGLLEEEAARARRQTEQLLRDALAIAGVVQYGPSSTSERLPHLICLGVSGVEAEAVLLGLDQAGVAAHSGSACSSESLEPSPVLEAMGVEAERSLRLSAGWSTTEEDVAVAAAALPGVIQRLRDLAAGVA
ncbi:MAG TPA: cysteine desulfurase family protein [Acidimicrobiales bacterium]|nr:cysteine desulfurase family protein [Acidimicrobiales bacterium]